MALSEINIEIIKHTTDKDDMISLIHHNPAILKIKETKSWQNSSKVITNCPAFLDQFLFMKPEIFEKICKLEKHCITMISYHPEIYKKLPSSSQTNLKIASFYLSKINEQDIFSGSQTVNTMVGTQYQKSDLHPDIFNNHDFCIKAFNISNLIINEFPQTHWDDKKFLNLFFTALDKMIVKTPSKTIYYVNLLPDNIKLEMKDKYIEPGKFTDYFSNSSSKKIKISV